MKHFEDYLVNQIGLAISNATVTVKLAGTATNATIYSDDGVTPKTNPLTSDISGKYDFYVADGRYDIVITGTGLTTRTLSDVEIGDVASSKAGGNPVYDVVAYGALGDGSTDDTAAIQAAINVARNGGGTVYFPCGKTFKYGTLDLSEAGSPRGWVRLLFCGRPKPTATMTLNMGMYSLEGAGTESSINFSFQQKPYTLFDISSLGAGVAPITITSASADPILIRNIGIAGATGSAINIPSGPVDVTIEDCVLSVADSSTSPVIDSSAGFGLRIRNTVLSGSNTNAQPALFSRGTGLITLDNVKFARRGFKAAVGPTGVSGTWWFHDITTENLLDDALFTIDTTGGGTEAWTLGPNIEIADNQPGGGLYLIKRIGTANFVKVTILPGVRGWSSAISNDLTNTPLVLLGETSSPRGFGATSRFVQLNGSNGVVAGPFNVNAFGRTGAVSNVTVSVDQVNTGNPAVVVKGLSGITSDLLQWTTDTDVVRGGIDSSYRWKICNSAGTFCTAMSSSPTANRVATFPDATITVAGINLAQTWTAKQTYNVPSSVDISAGNLNNIRICDGVKFGATGGWAQCITDADTDLGGGAGEIWITSSVSTTSTSAPTVSSNRTIRFMQPGTYSLNTGWTITDKTNVGIIGPPGTTISITAGSAGFKVDGNGLTNGSTDIYIENIEFKGSASVTEAVFFKKVARSTFLNLKARDATTAILCQFCISNTFIRPKVSSNDAAFGTVPETGLRFDQISAPSDGSANNTVIGGIFEGITASTGRGIYCVSGFGNTFVGGTSEGNDVGIELAANCGNNSFNYMDLESNTTDFIAYSRDNVLLSMRSTGTTNLKTDGSGLGLHNRLIGGQYNQITIDTNVANTHLEALGYNFAGTGAVTDNGTGTTRLRIYDKVSATYDADVVGLTSIKAQRFRASQATALVTGDFGSLSGGWGTTASISAIAANSRDQDFEVSIASSGTGQGANPTVTFTFKNGTFTTAPVLVCQRNDTLATAGRFAQTTLSATAPVFTFVGTPVAGETYKLACTFVAN